MEKEPKQQLVSTWQSITKDAEGEAHVHDLHKYVVLPDLSEFQAQRAIIRPSRAKPINREFTRIVAYGDAQIGYREYDGELHPIHDERALNVARMLARSADVLVNLGDNIDQPELSRFDPDSNHFNHKTYQAAFDRDHRFNAQLVADNPNSEKHIVDSNHNIRLARTVLKQLGILNGFRPPESNEEYPLLTYPHMSNLGSLAIWHSGYGAARYEYKDDLVFTHGKELRSSGSTAEMLNKKNPYNNLVVGHGHQAQTHVRTAPDGKYITTMQVGTLSKITGEVPGYGTGVDDNGHPVPRQQNQQQAIAVIDDYGEGNYNFQHIYIRDGKSYFEGKEYDGNDTEAIV